MYFLNIFYKLFCLFDSFFYILIGDYFCVEILFAVIEFIFEFVLINCFADFFCEVYLIFGNTLEELKDWKLEFLLKLF
jgi:hypothetical protein